MSRVRGLAIAALVSAAAATTPATALQGQRAEPTFEEQLRENQRRLETIRRERSTQEQELERLAAAVDRLARVDATLAQVVDLKFFCGFTFAEIGAMRGQSERTVQRHWEKARLFLHDAIGPGGPL